MASIASWQPRPGRNPYDFGSNRASHSGSSALAATACSALSAITGIPSGRRLPALPRLGIYTRLTGRATHGSARCRTHSARSSPASGVSAASPSTPAVLRPALTSVTRRTLTKAFDRHRSISFCKLRTLLRSPACDAVKIRCRKRRTFSSAESQLTPSQPPGPPSGPFTTFVASNLPFGSSVLANMHLTGSPDPRQRPFGPGHPARYPASYPGQPAEGASHLVPVSCCLSATGIRLSGHPVPARDLGLPYGRLTGHTRARTRTGFPRSAPARHDRGGCPLYPGDGGALLARCRARPAPAASQRPVPAPRTRIPPAGLRFTRHQRGFTRFTRQACPSPVTHRMGRQALGLSPVLRTPPLPAAHDRAGPGMSTRPELRDRHSRPSNPRVPSQGATSCRNGNSGCSPKWRRCINIRPGRLPAGPVTGTAMQRATWRAPYHRAHLAGRPVRSAAPGAHQLGAPGRGGSVLSACLPRGAEDEVKLAEQQGQR